MFFEKDGKFYRLRRGKLVEIPLGWLRKVTTKQTINRRKRASKLKHRNKGCRNVRDKWTSSE